MIDLISVGTAPSDDTPGAINITVQIQRGDVTTIVYQKQHPTDTAAMGVQGLAASRTIDTIAAALVQNETAWRETLLKEVIASTGRAPEHLVLVTQLAHDEQRIWFEPKEKRERIADLEQQLRSVTAAAADWSRRCSAAERQLAKLQAHLAEPDFKRLEDMRQSELTEAENADALEGWMRKNVGWFQSDHITFLLRRIDALRNPPKD